MILFAQGIWWVVVGRGRFFQKRGIAMVAEGRRGRSAPRRRPSVGSGRGRGISELNELGVSAGGIIRRGGELFLKNSDGRGVGGRRSVGRALGRVAVLGELVDGAQDGARVLLGHAHLDVVLDAVVEAAQVDGVLGRLRGRLEARRRRRRRRHRRGRLLGLWDWLLRGRRRGEANPRAQ